MDNILEPIAKHKRLSSSVRFLGIQVHLSHTSSPGVEPFTLIG